MDKRPDDEKCENKYVSVNTTCEIILQVPNRFLENDSKEPPKFHIRFKESDVQDLSKFALHRKENDKYPLFDGRTCMSPPKSPLKVKGSSRSQSPSSSDKEEINESPSRSWKHDYRYSPLKDLVKSSKNIKEYPENLKGSEKITSPLEQQKINDKRNYKTRHLKNNVNRHNKSPISVLRRAERKEIDSEYYEDRNHKSKDRNYKQKSSRAGSSRHSRENSTDDDRCRDHKIYEDCKYKGSIKRREKSRSQSCSRIRKIRSGSCDKEKYYRTSSSSRRRYKSPSKKRRSRSPYYQSHTSQHSRRDNYSPSPKRTSLRRFSLINKSGHERYDYALPDRKQDLTRSSYTSLHRRRSRSPDYRKYTSSKDIESGYKYERQNRSSYQTNSSKHGPSKPPLEGIYKHTESEDRYQYPYPSDKSHVGLDQNHPSLSIDYNYYGTEPFWITRPLPPGPGYMPRGFMPPSMSIPPALIHPPYITPRSFMPMLPPMQHQFRHRFPNVYSRQPRPRVITSISASTSKKTDTGNLKIVDHPSMPTVISKSPTSVLINPTVEESSGKLKNRVPVESENIEVAVQNKD